MGHVLRHTVGSLLPDVIEMGKFKDAEDGANTFIAKLLENTGTDRY